MPPAASRPPALGRAPQVSPVSPSAAGVICAWGAMLALALSLGGCGSSQGAPQTRAPVDSQWTSFARGLPADSFPAASRRFSRIVAPRWTDESSRDAASEAETVIAALPLTAGMSVADIGAGDGYYVTRMSQRVGPTGRVYGQDIIPEYLNLLADRVHSAGLRNVVVVRGEGSDPRLPRDSIDAAIMIHMYHEITEPYAQLWNLAQSLKPGAHLGILDTTYPTDQHGTPPWLLDCELGVVGYHKVRSMRTAADEYLTIFRAPARDSLPSPSEIRERVADGACVQR